MLELVLVPLFDKRLHPQLSGGKAMMSGTLTSIGSVACLVLLLACINYANSGRGYVADEGARSGCAQGGWCRTGTANAPVLR